MQQLPLTTGNLDLSSGLLSRSPGPPVQLSDQELQLMRYLAGRPNQDVPREALLEDVLGYRAGLASRAVDDAMKRLRVKVERLPARPFHLVGVRGVGYRFVPLSGEGGLGLLRLGAHLVDLERLEARSDKGVQSLSAIEGRLLEVLALHDGRPVEPDTLLREVWGVRNPAQRRLVDKAVYRLRQKLEEDAGQPTILRTVRGRGLVLESQGLSPRPELRPGRTPAPRMELLGRQALLRRVQALLRPPGAVVGLHGPGGIGKTALARWIAADREGPGVMVDLHEVRDEAGLVQVLAAALGVDSDRWDRIRGSLRQQPDLLLLLDNADVALGAVRAVASHLEETRLLVTSRQPPGLPREHAVAVGPLDEEDATTLLRRCAGDAGPTLDADDPRLRALARGLQGVPLALELAAARLRLLGIDGVLARLERPLELLRSSQGGRHGTMQVAVELSTDLLSEADRRLLSACTVFPGTFSIEAAEAVCGDLVLEPVEEGIERLLDHALLWGDGRGGLRLGLAVADVVSAWPDARDHLDLLRGRHLDWCAGLWQPGPGEDAPPPEELPRLRLELDGALAAIRWGLRNGALEPAARCTVWVAVVLLHSGRAAMAEQLLRELPELSTLPLPLQVALHATAVEVYSTTLDLRETALRLSALAAIAPPASPAACRALAGQYTLSTRGDPEERQRLRAEVEAMIEQVGGPGRVRLLRSRAWVRGRAGDAVAAREDLQQALTLALREGLAWECAVIYKFLAILAELDGRLAEAEGLLENRWRHLAPALSREEDGGGLVVLSRIRESQGRLQEAVALIEDQLLRARTQGHRANITHLLGSVANIRATMGELEAAVDAYTEALAHAQELDSRELVASLTLNMGEVRGWMGQPETALPLLRRGRQLFEENGERGYAAIARVLEARIRLRQGEPEPARALFTDAIATLVSLDRSQGLPEAQLGLAELMARAGEAGAEALADEGLERARASCKAADLVALISQRGEIALLLGDPALARRCLEESAALAERMGLGGRSGAGLAVARLRAALGP